VIIICRLVAPVRFPLTATPPVIGIVIKTYKHNTIADAYAIDEIKSTGGVVGRIMRHEFDMPVHQRRPHAATYNGVVKSLCR